ncbi:hypothetical protein P9112_009954 [Eukaryota sp. TZLM1-RC]
MPHNYDFLMEHDDINYLKDHLNDFGSDEQSHLKALRLHASEDTRVRALYTYFYLKKSQAEISQFFWVNQSTISRWFTDLFERKDKEKNNCTPIHSDPNSRTILNDNDIQYITLLLKKKPLLFLREIKRIIERELDKKVSISTVHRCLVDRCNFTRKKARRMVQRARLDLIVTFCNNFNKFNGVVVQEQLVFIDEVSFRVDDFPRKYVRSPSGKEVVSIQPQFKDGLVGFVVAITVDGYLLCHNRKGHLSRSLFIDFLKDLLRKGLLRTTGGRRSIIILDGCKIHKHPFINEAM